jgi:large subunit ribosomal protein L4
VKTLLVLPAANNNVYLSSRNLKKSKVITADQLNTYDVLNAGKLLLTADALKTLEEALAK